MDPRPYFADSTRFDWLERNAEAVRFGEQFVMVAMPPLMPNTTRPSYCGRTLREAIDQAMGPTQCAPLHDRADADASG